MGSVVGQSAERPASIPGGAKVLGTYRIIIIITVTSYLSLIETIHLSCIVYEIWPSIGAKSLYFATPLAFNASDGGFSWDDLRKILHGGHI